MCELFYIKNVDDKPIPRHRIRDMIDTAINGSYSNNDGFGVFNEDGIVFKTEQALHELNAQDVAEELVGSRELVMHVRMSTCGSVCKENAHPFEADDRNLAHNGKMRRLDSTEKTDITDSEKFLIQTVNTEADSEVERLKESLENTSGWLSIFYRNQNTGDTFYFRNGASFTFARTQEELIGATKANRLDFLDRIRNEDRFSVFGRHEPENGQIYRIDAGYINPKAEFDLADSLKTYSSGYSSMYGYNSSNRNQNRSWVRHNGRYMRESEYEEMVMEENSESSQSDHESEEDYLEKLYQDEEGL